MAGMRPLLLSVMADFLSTSNVRTYPQKSSTGPGKSLFPDAKPAASGFAVYAGKPAPERPPERQSRRALSGFSFPFPSS
jgi:hypothetical protein